MFTHLTSFVFTGGQVYFCVRRVTDFALGTRDNRKRKERRIGVRGYGGLNNTTNHASQDGFIYQHMKHCATLYVFYPPLPFARHCGQLGAITLEHAWRN